MQISPAIKSLKPYQGGKPISELKRELGLSDVIKLASNENPNKLSQVVKSAIISNIADICRYPDGNGFELKKELSYFLDVKPQQITLGNGSNDVLELIARVFVAKSSDEVIFSQYCFVVYPLVTQALGATAVITPAKNYGHNLDLMLKSITTKTKLIFIANPNNPTGTYLEDNEILNFLDKTPKNVIVVLDQAYYEYTTSKIGADIIKKYPNLIITRTFSKAYALAGLRVGYSISNTEIADYINRVRQPFNVNSLAQVAAIASLKDNASLENSIKQNHKGLKQLELGFKNKEIEYIPSVANFISVKVENALEKYQQLLKQGVIVRPVEMDNFLRISVGTTVENDKLLELI